jgi:hypothetical protein
MSTYSGVCRIYTPIHSVHLRNHFISVQLQTLLEDVLGGRHQVCLEMHFDTEIEGTLRCTGRPGSSKFRDALGEHEIE